MQVIEIQRRRGLVWPGIAEGLEEEVGLIVRFTVKGEFEQSDRAGIIISALGNMVLRRETCIKMWCDGAL